MFKFRLMKSFGIDLVWDLITPELMGYWPDMKIFLIQPLSKLRKGWWNTALPTGLFVPLGHAVSGLRMVRVFP